MEKSRGKSFPFRMLIAGIVILVELSLFFAIIVLLSTKIVPVLIFLEAISLIVAISMINKQDKPAFEVIWIVVIMLIPAFGGIFYLMFGSARVLPHKRKEMKAIEAEYLPLLDKNLDLQARIKLDSDTGFSQSKYIQQTSHYPVYNDTDVVYLSLGSVYLRRCLKSLS